MLYNIFIEPGTSDVVFPHFASQSVSMKCELWSRDLFVQKLNLMDWCEIHWMLWHCCHGLKIAGSTLVTFLALSEGAFISFEIAKRLSFLCLERKHLSFHGQGHIFALLDIIHPTADPEYFSIQYNSTGRCESPYVCLWICTDIIQTKMQNVLTKTHVGHITKVYLLSEFETTKYPSTYLR